MIDFFLLQILEKKMSIIIFMLINYFAIKRSLVSENLNDENKKYGSNAFHH